MTKDWVVDWRLIFRDEAACRKLMPSGLSVETSRSRNRSLTYATARRPRVSSREIALRKVQALSQAARQLR